MIFNMTGGGQPLNFKVVGNPQPASPSVNTIWVNTDVQITGWHFASEQPENLEEGNIWFPTSLRSPVSFSATKKNPVMVYPQFAKQYVNGLLVDKTAKTYNGVEWVDWWDGTLYDFGNEYKSVTGGWTAETIGSSSSAIIGTNSLTVSAIYSGQYATITTANVIDLTMFKTLNVNVTYRSSGDSDGTRCQIRVLDYKKNVISTTNVASKKNYAVDVTAVDAGYIQLYAFSAENYKHEMTVDKIKLE